MKGTHGIASCRRACDRASAVSVHANSRKVTHAGTGQTEVAAPPDVCKTPSPGGPVPVPYVNSAMDSQLAKGSKKTKIEGNPIALESSNISTSTGDEPGTAGGLISSKFKGKLTWGSASADVVVEGKGVVRFMDVTQHNGNSFNTAFMEQGGTGFAYGDDFEGPCPVCKKDPQSHAILERPEGSEATAKLILDDLRACEKAWTAANQKVVSAKAELRRLIESGTSVNRNTIMGRQQTISALQAARDGMASHRREDSLGYMFGVLVCLTGKKFAAVSGDEMPPAFARIASGHGCTLVKDAATLADFQAINPRGGAGAGAGALADQWRTAMLNHEDGRAGYNNRPGTCAGAKLVGKSGHVADSMTEIFFAFTGGKKALTFDVLYRGPAEFGPVKGPWNPPAREALATGGPYIEERRDMRRKKEQTVPSCRSCQDTLYLARCDLEQQSCG